MRRAWTRQWVLVPTVRPALLAVEKNPRLFWLAQVPAIALLASVFFVPAVRDWTGARPVPIALAFGLHLSAYLLEVYLPLGERWPRAWLVCVQALNLAVSAVPAATTGNPGSMLWAFYVLYPQFMPYASRPAVVSAGLITLVPVAISVLWRLTGVVPLAQSLGTVLPFALACTVGYAVLANLTAKLSDAQEDAERTRLKDAAVTERERIARHLHTSLGAALTEISMWQDIALATDGERSGEAQRKAHHRTRAALAELRSAVGALSADQAPVRDLEARVRGAVEALCVPAGVTAAIEVRAPAPCDAARAYHLLKIIEEATLNTVRHAGASSVRVRLELGGVQRLALTYSDDGRGFEVQTAPRGAGLRALDEHARQLGGRLELRSAPGQGTTLTLGEALAG